MFNYILKSFRCMGKKLYVLFFVLIISFFCLQIFYGETVRSHRFVTSLIGFRTEEPNGTKFSLKQWNEVNSLFKEYDEKIEGKAYATVYFGNVGKNVIVSRYFFKGGKNSFTEDEYKSCVRIVKMPLDKKKIKIHGVDFKVQKWDDEYCDVPVTTAAKEEIPVLSISISCDTMGGNDYKTLVNRLQKILPDYQCSTDDSEKVVSLEMRKTYMFIAVVLISVFNVAFIYQYIIAEQKKRIAVYRLCGCSNLKLYTMSIIEIFVLFIISYFIATLLYYLSYNGIYKAGMVSLKYAPGMSYLLTAGGVSGIITVILMFICTFGTMNKAVKDMYLEVRE